MSGMWEAAASARLNVKHDLFNRTASSAYYAIVTFALAQQTLADMKTFLAAIAAFIGQDVNTP